MPRSLVRIGTIQADESILIDFHSLLGALILSDHVVLDSVRLKELPYFVQMFGYGGTVDLLDSNRLSIESHANSLGIYGQQEIPENKLEFFDLVTINIADRKQYISDGLKHLNPLKSDYKTKEIVRLKKNILNVLIEPNKKRGTQAFNDTVYQFKNDIKSTKRFILLVLRDRHQIDLDFDRFQLEIEPSTNNVIRVVTNLDKLTNLNPNSIREIVQSSYLGAAGINHRLELMSELDAVGGVRESELKFLNSRVAHLVRNSDAGKDNVALFNRVIEVVDFPPIKPGQRIDIGKVLNFTASEEAKEFRRLLPEIGNWKDNEIKDYFNSISGRVGNLYNGTTANTVRFAIPLAVDQLLPGLGSAIGALDTFLVSRVVKENKSIIFLNEIYPSIFY